MIRKITLFCAVLCLIAAVTTSCKKATFFKADIADIEVPRSGGHMLVHLSSDVEDFEIKEVPEWVNAKLDHATLIVDVEANSTATMRSGNIVLVNTGMELVIPVDQYCVATRLSTNPSTVSIPKEGGSVTINVDCDGMVHVKVPAFINATYKRGKLEITAAGNEGAEKHGTIVLTADDLKTLIEISVEGNKCPTCNGTGKVTCPACHGTRFYGELYEDCETCGGCGLPTSASAFARGGQTTATGKVTCPTCNGRGY